MAKLRVTDKENLIQLINTDISGAIADLERESAQEIRNIDEEADARSKEFYGVTALSNELERLMWEKSNIEIRINELNHQIRERVRVADQSGNGLYSIGNKKAEIKRQLTANASFAPRMKQLQDERTRAQQDIWRAQNDSVVDEVFQRVRVLLGRE